MYEYPNRGQDFKFIKKYINGKYRILIQEKGRKRFEYCNTLEEAITKTNPSKQAVILF